VAAAAVAAVDDGEVMGARSTVVDTVAGVAADAGDAGAAEAMVAEAGEITNSSSAAVTSRRAAPCGTDRPGMRGDGRWRSRAVISSRMLPVRMIQDAQAMSVIAPMARVPSSGVVKADADLVQARH
jgi:hypothetical protein